MRGTRILIQRDAGGSGSHEVSIRVEDRMYHLRYVCLPVRRLEGTPRLKFRCVGKSSSTGSLHWSFHDVHSTIFIQVHNKTSYIYSAPHI